MGRWVNGMMKFLFSYLILYKLQSPLFTKHRTWVRCPRCPNPQSGWGLALWSSHPVALGRATTGYSDCHTALSILESSFEESSDTWHQNQGLDKHQGFLLQCRSNNSVLKWRVFPSKAFKANPPPKAFLGSFLDHSMMFLWGCWLANALHV